MNKSQTSSEEVEKYIDFLYEHTNLYGAVMKHRTIMEKAEGWRDVVLDYIRTLEHKNAELVSKLKVAKEAFEKANDRIKRMEKEFKRLCKCNHGTDHLHCEVCNCQPND